MFRYTFRCEGLDELQRSWEVFGDSIMESAGPALMRAAVAGQTVGNSKIGGSGRLRESSQIRMMRQTRNNAEVRLSWEEPYASFVDQGARPHDIRPKAGHGFKGPIKEGQTRRKVNDIGTHRVALRFPDASGEMIFRYVIRSPGIPNPVHFSEAAMDAIVVVLTRELEIAINRAAVRLHVVGR